MVIDFDEFFERPEQAPPSEEALRRQLADFSPCLGHRHALAHVTQLSGGYRNFNYLLSWPTENAQQPAVLRLAHDHRALRRELALLRYLQGRVRVPAVLAERPGAALLAFCPGSLPCRLEADLPAAELRQLGAAIGAELAAIHRIRCERAGFFNAELQIGEPLEPFAEAWSGYIRDCLGGSRVRERAGSALCQAALELFERKRPLLEALTDTDRLVHSDFNLKNLLVEKTDGRWRVRAVLDWEFAHAGSPLGDLGNFLRFEDRLPQALIEGFVAAYAELAPLPPNWREQALLLDMAALCGFLDSAEARPRSWATAVNRLQRTLALLGYSP